MFPAKYNKTSKAFLAWWPLQLSAGEEVQMQMINALTAELAIVDHDTVAIIKLQVFGNLK